MNKIDNLKTTTAISTPGERKAGEIIWLSVVVNRELGFERELRELRYVW